MIIENIYKIAKGRLKGKKLDRVLIGISLLCTSLDDGTIGVTYVLRNEIDGVCGSLPEGNMVGMDGAYLGSLAVEGDNVLSRALGLSVINSQERVNGDFLYTDEDTVTAANLREEDVVGVVGHIGPVIMRATGHVKEILVFERDEKKEGFDTDLEELKRCDVVFITSATFVNNTLEEVLEKVGNPREVVLVGSTTPLYPEAFTKSKVTMLSGTRWLPEYKEEIFNEVGQGASMRQLIKRGEKVTIKIK